MHSAGHSSAASTTQSANAWGTLAIPAGSIRAVGGAIATVEGNRDAEDLPVLLHHPDTVASLLKHLWDELFASACAHAFVLVDPHLHQISLSG